MPRKILLHAVGKTGGAIASVGGGLIAHHRQHGTLAAELLADEVASVVAHTQVVRANDHRQFAAARADVDIDHRHVLIRREVQRRDDGIAVRGYGDQALSALRDQIVKVRDLLAGVAVGVCHGQGLQPQLLRGGHGLIHLGGLERISQETDRIAHRERLGLLSDTGLSGAHRGERRRRQARLHELYFHLLCRPIPGFRPRPAFRFPRPLYSPAAGGTARSFGCVAATDLRPGARRRLTT